MALHVLRESDELDRHSLSGENDAAAVMMEPPMHPVPSMQRAFVESIIDATEGEDAVTVTELEDADARRQKLLDAKQYDASWTARWKQKPGARYHPLLKLMAQLVFGMHLLQQQQAKSDDEVVKILQTHVNDVDSFLERTGEDFDLAITDIEERIRHLELPMEHLDVFSVMLDDRKFRTQLLDGNDQIEKIIDRTAKARQAALADLQKGLLATQELGMYLDRVREGWPQERRDIANVYGAMRGNEQGWRKYLNDLHVKASNLNDGLVQLGTAIGEISMLAAAASRRNKLQNRPASPALSTATTPGLRSKFSRDSAAPTPISRVMSLNKPLPKAPGGESAAAAARQRHAPSVQRHEQSRQSFLQPPRKGQAPSSAAHDSSPRPKTAGSQSSRRRFSRFGAGGANAHAQHSNPLRSNPPEDRRPSTHGNNEVTKKNLHLLQSQGAKKPSEPVVPTLQAAPAARSKTQGTTMVVTSRPGSQDVDKALSIRSAPLHRRDSDNGSGFTSRFSMRMKHAPPLAEDVRAEESTPAAPPDSAYSSDTEKQGSDPATTATATRPTTSGTLSANKVPGTLKRLGLFPKVTEPLTPSAASMRSTHAAPSVMDMSGGYPSSRTPTVAPSIVSTQAPRFKGLNLKNLFHRKRQSRDVY